MSEGKRVILPGWSENEQAEAFQKIAEVCYKKNFGRLSKADMEVLLFSIYLEHCLRNGKAYDDYTLAIQLGIPETRVRNLKVKKELQYPYSEYDWKKAFGERIQYAKYDDKKALVKVSILDPNVRRDVEHYIDLQNWYSEYQLNSKLLQMRADQFIEMCMKLYSRIPVDGEPDIEAKQQIQERLKAAEASQWAKESATDILARINKEGFQNCWKDVVKSGSKVAIKAVLSLIPFGKEFQELIDYFIQKL